MIKCEMLSTTRIVGKSEIIFAGICSMMRRLDCIRRIRYIRTIIKEEKIKKDLQVGEKVFQKSLIVKFLWVRKHVPRWYWYILWVDVPTLDIRRECYLRAFLGGSTRLFLATHLYLRVKSLQASEKLNRTERSSREPGLSCTEGEESESSQRSWFLGLPDAMERNQCPEKFQVPI